MDCWSSGSSSSSVNINWLVTDQLGTPRMIFDKTGALANVKRHDYAPFGEELFNGLRTTAMGYAAADSTRQKFTHKERDIETGLDYFLARYYSSTQGRFTSPDSVCGCIKNPQTQNLYAYVHNNPLNLLDPTGHSAETLNKDQDQRDRDKKDEKRKRNEARQRQDDINSLIESGILPGGFGGADAQNSQQLAINAAVTDALSILSTDNPCSQFFGGSNPQNGSRDGTEVLTGLAKVLRADNISAIDTSTGIQLSNFSNVENTQTGLEYQMPASAIVNQRGPFFGSGSFGSFGSTSRAGRALAILHEVAHLIKAATVIEFDKHGREKVSDMWLIPEDGGKPDLSRENSARVEAACRDQLKALK